MKKLYLITFLFLFVTLHSYSQRRGQGEIKYISLSVKGGGGESFFLNTDIFDEKNAGYVYFTPSYTVGSRLTITYGNYHGGGIEAMYTSFGQNYSLLAATGESYTKLISAKSIDYTLFYRYTGQKRGYFEIGPGISMIKSVEEKNSITDPRFRDSDLQDVYSDRITSAMIGFGVVLVDKDPIRLNLGARISYSFTNFVSDPNYYVIDDNIYVPSSFTGATTNPVKIMALLEFNYFFAFWGDASCGRGRLMFFQ